MEQPSRVVSGTRLLLNDELIEELCIYIESGNFIRTACALCGISQPVFYRWMKKGRENVDPIYVKFMRSVERAEAICEAKVVKTWKDQTPTDWRAAQAFLARRFPSRWGEQSKEINVKHMGADGGPIQVEQSHDLSKLSMEELKMLEKLTDKITSEGSDTAGDGVSFLE